MDNISTPSFDRDLDLDAFAEELDDTFAAALSTAGSFSTVSSGGGCVATAASFSSASS